MTSLFLEYTRETRLAASEEQRWRKSSAVAPRRRQRANGERGSSLFIATLTLLHIILTSIAALDLVHVPTHY